VKSSVVIGANWGDEGKGLMTDCLCRLHKADLVVRFNGGAQAGHTVVTPEGKRHVFNHIGSGYFAGVPTFLSEYFILNPIIFRREYEELEVPREYPIYVSSVCRITTYWDMLANRCLEQMRGGNAHGSCGCGINETVEREKNLLLLSARLWVYENKIHMLDLLKRITDFWFNRLVIAQNQYGVPTLPEWVTGAFSRQDEINKQFCIDTDFMFSHIKMADDDEVWKLFDYGVFEGAQGLRLDQFYGNYPYVTSSNTGMRNVLELQRNGNMAGGENFSIDEIVYVSRTYETRHGRDPFFIETSSKNLLERVGDSTNSANEWQGAIRYAKLNYYNLGNRIGLDIWANNLHSYARADKIRLAMTHCDQNRISNGDIFYRVGANTWGAINKASYKSYGETYKDVKYILNDGRWKNIS
jgi:adenylosuccinate synthase